MAISFGAIGEKYVTFLADETAEEGIPCKVSENRTVGACDEDDAFCGIITQVRGGAASVLMAGYAELPYSGSAPSVGFATLLADGEGGVCADEDGREYLIVSVDTTAGKIGLFL